MTRPDHQLRVLERRAGPAGLVLLLLLGDPSPSPQAPGDGPPPEMLELMLNLELFDQQGEFLDGEVDLLTPEEPPPQAPPQDSEGAPR